MKKIYCIINQPVNLMIGPIILAIVSNVDVSSPSVCALNARTHEANDCCGTGSSSFFNEGALMQARVYMDIEFTAEEKASVNLTGHSIKTSYGGAWEGDSLACSQGKYSGNVWETMYLFHKLTGVEIQGNAHIGWSDAGNRNNPDKPPFTVADGSDDIIVGWQDAPSLDRIQYYSDTNSAMNLGAGSAPSNVDLNDPLDLVVRAEDYDEFSSKIAAANATFDVSDNFAISRFLTQEILNLQEGTRVPKLVACPCAIFNKIVYVAQPTIPLDPQDHYLFGNVTHGSDPIDPDDGYDHQWYRAVRDKLGDYTIVARKKNVGHPVFTGHGHNSLEAMYPTLKVLTTDPYRFSTPKSDTIFVAKDSLVHDKLLEAAKIIVRHGLYDSVQTKWDKYAKSDIGKTPGACSGSWTEGCYALTDVVPVADTPINDETFSFCNSKTYMSHV